MSASFGFQQDIVSTASITHLLTGKALKALSDGGVDFYSVAAAVFMGKQFPVRTSLESTVHAHIASRGGMQSFISKALSIGWGHSGLAVEMTRTRAGTNALLLIGALATGYSNFAAAQCMSELLTLAGCEADKLPNVDVLRHMMEYFAPFVHDLGFSKVLEHINSTGRRAIALHFERDSRDRRECEERLEALGSASVLAGAISQLKLTAERDESIYMVTKIRGSWLATFASHILGMSTELRLGDVIVWASGGERGHVALQLRSESAQGDRWALSSSIGISIVDEQGPSARTDSIGIDYPMGDTLDRILNQEGNMAEDIKQIIHRAIWNQSFFALYRRHGAGESNFGRVPMVQFDSRKALKETLGHLGVESQPTEDSIEYSDENVSEALRLIKPDGFIWGEFFFIDPADQNAIKTACGCSHCDNNTGKDKTFLGCFKRLTSLLIRGFVPLALALMHYQFDPTKLRIREDYLYGYHVTEWSQYVLSTDETLLIGQLSYIEALMFHIYPDLIGAGSEKSRMPPNRRVIGSSGGAFTICHTCVLQQDAYDDCGRFLSIIHGRISMSGMLRPTIEETGRHVIWKDRQVTNEQFPSSIATGSYLEPHYHPSSATYEINADLEENSIFFYARLIKSGEPVLQACLTRCVEDFTENWDIPRCDHGRDKPYRVTKGKRILMVGSSPLYTDLHESQSTDIYVFAVRGKKVNR